MHCWGCMVWWEAEALKACSSDRGRNFRLLSVENLAQFRTILWSLFRQWPPTLSSLFLHDRSTPHWTVYCSKTLFIMRKYDSPIIFGRRGASTMSWTNLEFPTVLPEVDPKYFITSCLTWKSLWRSQHRSKQCRQQASLTAPGVCPEKQLNQK